MLGMEEGGKEVEGTRAAGRETGPARHGTPQPQPAQQQRRQAPAPSRSCGQVVPGAGGGAAPAAALGGADDEPAPVGARLAQQRKQVLSKQRRHAVVACQLRRRGAEGLVKPGGTDGQVGRGTRVGCLCGLAWAGPPWRAYAGLCCRSKGQAGGSSTRPQPHSTVAAGHTCSTSTQSPPTHRYRGSSSRLASAYLQ